MKNIFILNTCVRNVSQLYCFNKYSNQICQFVILKFLTLLTLVKIVNTCMICSVSDSSTRTYLTRCRYTTYFIQIKSSVNNVKTYLLVGWFRHILWLQSINQSALNLIQVLHDNFFFPGQGASSIVFCCSLLLNILLMCSARWSGLIVVIWVCWCQDGLQRMRIMLWGLFVKLP